MSSLKDKFEKESYQFLDSNLKKLKIKKNDCIYFGLDLKNFYVPFIKYFKDEPKLLNNEYLCSLFLKNLKQYFLPNGTIVFPSFTWEFIKKKKFHIKKTIPQLGIFEKYIFNKKDFLRSAHPINSIVSIGKKSKYLTKDHGLFSFGANSPYNKFNEIDLKFVNIGVPFYNSCTFSHHLEHINGVNHRFYKIIRGSVFEKNKYIKKNFFFLVKYKYFDKYLERNEQFLNKILIKKNKAKKFTSKNVFFFSSSSNDVTKIGLDILKSCPSGLMKKKIFIYLKEGNKLMKNKNKKNIVFKLDAK